MDESSGESLNWRRSSFCDTSACVEVAIDGSVVFVRQSNQPDEPILAFTRREWTEFMAGVWKGEFEEFDID